MYKMGAWPYIFLPLLDLRYLPVVDFYRLIKTKKSTPMSILRRTLTHLTPFELLRPYCFRTEGHSVSSGVEWRQSGGGGEVGGQLGGIVF